MHFDVTNVALSVIGERERVREMPLIRSRGIALATILLTVSGFLLAACGGAGESTQGQTPAPPPAGPVSVLAWDPPANYADNAAMDPYRDLDHYELYVRLDGNFSDTDLPVAMIAAVVEAPANGGNPGARLLEREFILENVQPFIPPGNRHYVSLKAVGIDGQKSGFMTPVAWDQI